MKKNKYTGPQVWLDNPEDYEPGVTVPVCMGNNKHKIVETFVQQKDLAEFIRRLQKIYVKRSGKKKKV